MTTTKEYGKEFAARMKQGFSDVELVGHIKLLKLILAYMEEREEAELKTATLKLKVDLATLEIYQNMRLMHEAHKTPPEPSSEFDDTPPDLAA